MRSAPFGGRGGDARRVLLQPGHGRRRFEARSRRGGRAVHHPVGESSGPEAMGVQGRPRSHLCWRTVRHLGFDGIHPREVLEGHPAAIRFPRRGTAYVTHQHQDDCGSSQMESSLGWISSFKAHVVGEILRGIEIEIKM